jgi:hypothetical protein
MVSGRSQHLRQWRGACGTKAFTAVKALIKAILKEHAIKIVFYPWQEKLLEGTEVRSTARRVRDEDAERLQADRRHVELGEME